MLSIHACNSRTLIIGFTLEARIEKRLMSLMIRNYILQLCVTTFPCNFVMKLEDGRWSLKLDKLKNWATSSSRSSLGLSGQNTFAQSFHTLWTLIELLLKNMQIKGYMHKFMVWKYGENYCSNSYWKKSLHVWTSGINLGLCLLKVSGSYVVTLLLWRPICLSGIWQSLS
jgi:hypothetical protein